MAHTYKCFEEMMEHDWNLNIRLANLNKCAKPLLDVRYVSIYRSNLVYTLLYLLRKNT